MVDFLLDRKHRTRYAGQQSVDASINASVVQGPALALRHMWSWHQTYIRSMITMLLLNLPMTPTLYCLVPREIPSIKSWRASSVGLCSITSSLIITNLRKCCSEDELELSFYLRLYLGLNELTL